MLEPTHDEAVTALQAIRKATDFADVADYKAFMAREAAKEAKAIAKSANAMARVIARQMTRELPLFDEADGLAPASSAPETVGKLPEQAPGRQAAKRQVDAELQGTAMPLPPDETPVSVLILPEETHSALAGFGFALMTSLVSFHRTGVDWTCIPGIDEGGAKRLESAISRFLLGEPQSPEGAEGRAA